jgi:hypothetical protein
MAVLAVSRLAEGFVFCCVASAGLHGLHMRLPPDEDDVENYEAFCTS